MQQYKHLMRVTQIALLTLLFTACNTNTNDKERNSNIVPSTTGTTAVANHGGTTTSNTASSSQVQSTAEDNGSDGTANNTNDNLVGTNNDNNRTNNNNYTTGNDQNHTGSTESNATTEANTTTIALKTLMLTVNKSTLNKDTNTTLKVEALYKNNTKEDVTTKVKWIEDKQGIVSIYDHTLTAKEDKDITLQAKLDNKTSNPIKLHIYWKVNGHTLPPEPDPKVNNATLLGVDVNDNGVRDDVERWIYREYKDKHPIYIDISMQEARGNKLVLEHPEKAKEIYPEVEKAIDCQAYYMYSAKYYGDSILIKEDAIDEYFTKKIYFNTSERMDAYDKYDTLLSGDSYPLPTAQERKAACDFNTSKYEE